MNEMSANFESFTAILFARLFITFHLAFILLHLFIRSRGPFLEAPGNYRARSAVLFSIPDGSFKTFENYRVKFSAKETKWTSLEARTHPTFL